MSHTEQMETDTAVEEREVLLQRAIAAFQANHPDEIREVRDQLREYRDQFHADPALDLVDEHLRKLDAALGEPSPDTYAYAENDPQ